MMVIDMLDKNASGYKLIQETSDDKSIKHGANCAAKALEGMARHLDKFMAQMILDNARNQPEYDEEELL